MEDGGRRPSVLASFGHLCGRLRPNIPSNAVLNERTNARIKSRGKMKPSDLEPLSLDELWSLHEQVDAILARKLSAEKVKLIQRLRQLTAQQNPNTVNRSRAPYPPVFPKYVNPAEPSETWSGRGMVPRWLKAQLSSGKQLDDFRIPPSSDRGLRVVHRQ